MYKEEKETGEGMALFLRNVDLYFKIMYIMILILVN